MPSGTPSAQTDLMDNTSQPDNTDTDNTGDSGKDVGDPDTDHTVENADEVAGGYGGPLPTDPEVEQADAAPSE